MQQSDCWRHAWYRFRALGYENICEYNSENGRHPTEVSLSTVADNISAAGLFLCLSLDNGGF